LHSLLLPRTRRGVVTGAVAVLATFAMAAPSGAATMVESTSATSLNYSAGATSLNFAQPADSRALNFSLIG
jgi:hypothetical protein